MPAQLARDIRVKPPGGLFGAIMGGIGGGGLAVSFGVIGGGLEAWLIAVPLPAAMVMHPVPQTPCTVYPPPCTLL